MSWDCADDYEYMKHHTPEYWAWEFIRRDNRYKELWALCLEIFKLQRKGELENPKGAAFSDPPCRHRVIAHQKVGELNKKITSMFKPRSAFSLANFGFQPSVDLLKSGKLNAQNKASIEASIDRFDCSYKDRAYAGDILIEDDKHPEFFVRSYGAGAPWRMSYLCNPDTPKPLRLKFVGACTLADSLLGLGLPEPDDKTWYARFDLTAPIASQIEYIKAHLEAAQQELLCLGKDVKTRSSKPNSMKQDLWVLYLRVLDAKASGAKRKQAAPVIFPNFVSPEDKYSDQLKQAKRMQSSGFIDLVIGDVNRVPKPVLKAPKSAL